MIDIDPVSYTHLDVYKRQGIIVAVALSGVFDGDRSFVILMTAVYLLLNNCSNFFGYLFQAMNESKLYSISTIINCTCFLAPLLVMLVTGDSDFRHYVFFYAIARLASLGFSLWKGRDFLHAGLVDIQTSFRLAWKSIRAGSKLLLSTIAGSLILGIARFMVDANWGIEEFSIVSLAVSITSFVMTLVSQASMVLFPALRQAEKDEAVNFYLAASNALDVLLPLTYVLYAPMAALLTWWLPQYEASFTFFALLMPLCIFNSRMGVVGNTFLWVLRKESRLLAINIATLGISALFAVVGTFWFHSIGIVFGGAVLWVQQSPQIAWARHPLLVRGSKVGPQKGSTAASGYSGSTPITDRKSTRLNSSHITRSRMPSSA